MPLLALFPMLCVCEKLDFQKSFVFNAVEVKDKDEKKNLLHTALCRNIAGDGLDMNEPKFKVKDLP